MVVSYGITVAGRRQGRPGRAPGRASRSARCGSITVWPFPEKRIRELAGRVKAFVVPEINLGQIVREVERCACGRGRVISVPHCGGWVHDPDVILEAIKEAAR